MKLNNVSSKTYIGKFIYLFVWGFNNIQFCSGSQKLLMVAQGTIWNVDD